MKAGVSCSSLRSLSWVTRGYPARAELLQLILLHLPVLRVVLEEGQQLFYVDCGFQDLQRDVRHVSPPEDLADLLVRREAAVLDVVLETVDAFELDGLAEAVLAVGQHLVHLGDLVLGQQADFEAWSAGGTAERRVDQTLDVAEVVVREDDRDVVVHAVVGSAQLDLGLRHLREELRVGAVRVLGELRLPGPA